MRGRNNYFKAQLKNLRSVSPNQFRRTLNLIKSSDKETGKKKDKYKYADITKKVSTTMKKLDNKFGQIWK